MGSITAILPILYMIAKPTFGLILDYFHTQKKLLFMTILVITSSSYILLYFLPSLPKPILSDHQFQNISYASLPSCDVNYVSLYFFTIIYFFDNILTIKFLSFLISCIYFSTIFFTKS